MLWIHFCLFFFMMDMRWFEWKGWQCETTKMAKHAQQQQKRRYHKTERLEMLLTIRGNVCNRTSGMFIILCVYCCRCSVVLWLAINAGKKKCNKQLIFYNTIKMLLCTEKEYRPHSLGNCVSKAWANDGGGGASGVLFILLFVRNSTSINFYDSIFMTS